MTTIINLYGGPGTGKSTSAAYLFYLLKIQNQNAELVREYVKDWAWEGRKININDQIYFLGKQVRKESMLYNKVNWIVTDSPVMMNLYYAQQYCSATITSGVKALNLAFYKQAEDDGHKHIHVFLKRTKPYLAEGRYQSEVEARRMDLEVKELLVNLGVSFIESGVDEDELSNLLIQIMTGQS
jgi:ABC-type glutathione transport system ATPase component